MTYGPDGTAALRVSGRQVEGEPLESPPTAEA